MFPDNMSKDEFLLKIGEILDGSFNVFTLTAKSVKVDNHITDAPVGIIHETLVWDGAGSRVEPHAVYFPWAGPRNRMEASLAYLNRRRKETPIVIWSPMEHKDFFIQMARYGILRRMGTLKHSSGHRALFQVVEEENGFSG